MLHGNIEAFDKHCLNLSRLRYDHHNGLADLRLMESKGDQACGGVPGQGD